MSPKGDACWYKAVTFPFSASNPPKNNIPEGTSPPGTQQNLAETGLYYLQSRYYDPDLGRFINADAFTSTGQGLLGNNMFAYCGNNPVMYIDPSGKVFKSIADWLKGIKKKGENGVDKVIDFFANDDEENVVNAKNFAFYKGKLFVKVPLMENSAFSFGVVFMGSEIKEHDLVRHEYGHAVHLDRIGALDYITKVALPSVISFWAEPNNPDYYSQPWEYIADVLGGVDESNREYLPNTDVKGELYYLFTLF